MKTVGARAATVTKTFQTRIARRECLVMQICGRVDDEVMGCYMYQHITIYKFGWNLKDRSV